MSTTSAFFPLATETSVDDGAPEYHGPDSNSGTEQGASGKSQGAVGISKGGLVAIIVVVVAVSVIGSGFLPDDFMSPSYPLTRCSSFHGSTILPGQEEGMEDSRKHPQVRPQGRHGPHAAPVRVPQGAQGPGTPIQVPRKSRSQ
jgi:hypothetical protein